MLLLGAVFSLLFNAPVVYATGWAQYASHQPVPHTLLADPRDYSGSEELRKIYTQLSQVHGKAERRHVIRWVNAQTPEIRAQILVPMAWGEFWKRWRPSILQQFRASLRFKTLLNYVPDSRKAEVSHFWRQEVFRGATGRAEDDAVVASHGPELNPKSQALWIRDAASNHFSHANLAGGLSEGERASFLDHLAKQSKTSHVQAVFGNGPQSWAQEFRQAIVHRLEYATHYTEAGRDSSVFERGVYEEIAGHVEGRLRALEKNPEETIQIIRHVPWRPEASIANGIHTSMQDHPNVGQTTNYNLTRFCTPLCMAGELEVAYAALRWPWLTRSSKLYPHAQLIQQLKTVVPLADPPFMNRKVMHAPFQPAYLMHKRRRVGGTANE